MSECYHCNVEWNAIEHWNVLRATSKKVATNSPREHFSASFFNSQLVCFSLFSILSSSLSHHLFSQPAPLHSILNSVLIVFLNIPVAYWGTDTLAEINAELCFKSIIILRQMEPFVSSCIQRVFPPFLATAWCFIRLRILNSWLRIYCSWNLKKSSFTWS